MVSDNVSFTLSTEESRDAEEVIEEQYKNKSDGLRGLLELAANDKVQQIAEYHEVDVVEAVEMAVDGYVVPDESGDPLGEYDPESEGVTLSTDVLREIQPMNPNHEVNPDHIDSLPQTVEAKKAVVTAIIRYDSKQLPRDHVREMCKDVLGVQDSTIEKKDYFEDVLDNLIPHPVESNPMYYTHPKHLHKDLKSQLGPDGMIRTTLKDEIVEMMEDDDADSDDIKEYLDKTVDEYNAWMDVDMGAGVLTDEERDAVEDELKEVIEMVTDEVGIDVNGMDVEMADEVDGEMGELMDAEPVQ
ncbi:hypothetical protein HTZ84_04990 [Haloterrigena sp. SYSU A558-1]|uniref:Uncharacterized protein n=1 Tax=Haloterrigena gelatinilytica TaxID=2741724 RepID=A0ABX2LDM3_9EURY|nr:hypothetical protein [Haloterrigena gelatinilytica]NUC71672.1 hypothetical protein [Haloterrigena gelatinilytica]